MSELLEQQMRQLKLGGMAKEWRSIEFHDIEQYVGELLKLELHEREVNRINRMVKSALPCAENPGRFCLEQLH